MVSPLGYFWRNFKEDRREKWRESSFSECLIGRGREKKWWWTQMFSPHLGWGWGGEAQCIELMKMPMEGWQFCLYKKFMSRKFASPLKPNIISFKFFTITKIAKPLLCCFALLSLGKKKNDRNLALIPSFQLNHLWFWFWMFNFCLLPVTSSYL